MAEITNELIYEVLKAIQQRMTNLEDKVMDLNSQFVAMRQHMTAIQGDVNNLYVKVASVESRLARIERRLDIVDEPVT
jgi:chromosome segregation ATPase